MDEAGKLSCRHSLLFPTRLKMVKRSAHHIFNTGRKADVLEKEVTAATHVFFRVISIKS